MSKSEREYLSDPASGKQIVIIPNNESERKEQHPYRNEPEEAVYTEIIVAPDGGYGWVILVASFVVNVIVDGIIFSFGVLKDPVRDEFSSTDGAVAWVGSLMAGFYLLAGPIVSGLCTKYGARTVTVAGAFVAAAGIALSSLATSLGAMMALFGLLAGIGFGMAYLPAIVIVGEYFEKRRAFATGLAVAGSGIGGIIFPLLIEHLIGRYDWRGALLVLAGIAFNCALFGAFFRPLLPIRRREEPETHLSRSDSFIQRKLEAAKDERINKLNREGDLEMDTVGDDVRVVSGRRMEKIDETDLEKRIELTYLPGSNGNMVESQARHRHNSSASRKSTHSSHANVMRPDALYSGSVTNLAEVKQFGSVHEFRRATSKHAVNTADRVDSRGRSGCCPASVGNVLHQMLDVSLLRSPTFLLTCFTSFMTLAGFFIPFVYIKSLLKERGVSEDESTMALMCISVTNTIGRVVVGFVSDYPQVDPIVIACSSLIIGGIATVFAPYYSGIAMFMVYALVFGLAISAFAALRSIILVDLFGIAMLNNSFGLQMLFQGVATLVGSPIAGSIADATGSYNSAFYFAGVLIAVSGALLFPAKLVQRWEKRRFGGKFA